ARHAVLQPAPGLGEVVYRELAQSFREQPQRIVFGKQAERIPHSDRVERTARSEIEEAQLKPGEREVRRDLDCARHRLAALVVALLSGKHRALQEVQPRIERPSAEEPYQRGEAGFVVAAQLVRHFVESMLRAK